MTIEYTIEGAEIAARRSVPPAAYAMDSHVIDSHVRVHRHVEGISVVSHVRITVGDTTYDEVAVHDTRPLDVRQWKWLVIGSNLDRLSAHLVYRAALDAVDAGHRVFGVRWVNAQPEAVITRDCAARCGITLN